MGLIILEISISISCLLATLFVLSVFTCKELLLFFLLNRKNIQGIKAVINEMERIAKANQKVTVIKRAIIAVCPVSGTALFFISQRQANINAITKSRRCIRNGIKKLIRLISPLIAAMFISGKIHSKKHKEKQNLLSALYINVVLTILYFLCIKRNKMILYDACPCCGQKNIVSVLSAEDYTVSHQRFEIWECKDCTLRFTQKIPGINEIGSYYQSENYISHSDTSKGFINKLYHKVRSRTLIKKRNMIKKVTAKSEGSILDVGCGTGAFLNTMQRSGWQITGLEPDETARKKAKELYGLDLEPPEKLFSLPATSFDAITMWHVLEHVHELHRYIETLKNLLKPGGKLFIAVPNYTSYDAKVYKEFWAAYDVPRHLYHFSPASMRKLLSMHNMEVISIEPMWYDSFYVSMLGEKYKNGSSNILKALIKGGVSNLKAFSDKGKCSSIIYVISPQRPSEREQTSL